MELSLKAIRKWKRRNAKSKERVALHNIFIPGTYTGPKDIPETATVFETLKEKAAYVNNQGSLVILSKKEDGSYDLIQGIQALENLLYAGVTSIHCYVTEQTREEWEAEIFSLQETAMKGGNC